MRCFSHWDVSPLVHVILHWSYQFLLRIPRSDQFGAGVAFHLGRTIQDICLVGALVVTVGSKAPDTLFLFLDTTSQHLLSWIVFAWLDLVCEC